MPHRGKMRVVFCWHMHQPDYRDVTTGEYVFPWTYLHALKDYVDMAAHLEAQPAAQAVFNYTPVLIEQLEDYTQQIDAWLAGQGGITDPLLAALVSEDLPKPGSDAFGKLIHACLRVNRQRVIERFPDYHRLAKLVDISQEQDDLPMYLNQQLLVDILVWYHLGWMAETTRRRDQRLQRLQDKGHSFSLEDRRELMTVIGEEIASIKPRYRALAERGQIEICVSPYAHPIVPLLLDINSAREAMPDVALPKHREYPGGDERARWHLEQALVTFERFFGFRPSGCWASEGALSDATLALLPEYGFRWTATGDSVLHNSLRHSDNRHQAAAAVASAETFPHRAFQFNSTEVRCFFRDDGLSDLIGFNYSDWHADDAVANLMGHLENIAQACPDRNSSVISIVMDGENAWEYYPENGYHFLSELYRRLIRHPMLETTTYSRLLDEQQPESLELPHLVAGSWVYGTFSTWIGDPDKNRGWDLLCQAKVVFDRVLAQGKLDDAQAAKARWQLALCEGSDWFWWFGDYNPAESVSDFEYLYRRHLMNLYTLLGEPVPEALSQPICEGHGDPAHGGVMRHGHAEAEGAN